MGYKESDFVNFSLMNCLNFVVVLFLKLLFVLKVRKFLLMKKIVRVMRKEFFFFKLDFWEV